MEGSVNIHWVKVVDGVVQVFDIHDGFLSNRSHRWLTRGMKSLSVIRSLFLKSLSDCVSCISDGLLGVNRFGTVLSSR